MEKKMFFFSSVDYSKRSNGYFLECTDAQIAKFCKKQLQFYRSYSNINSSYLDDKGLHLLDSGKMILANNVINRLNTFFHQPLSHPNQICTSENCGNLQHDLQMLQNERLKFNKNPLLGYLIINSLRNKIIDLREIIQ